MIKNIVDHLAPDLINKPAVGYESAAQLLITAGDNPERLSSEAAFAALCGVSPIPASSGKTHRHRLNRGGDRQANSALHIIAIGRLRTDPRTQEYVAVSYTHLDVYKRQELRERAVRLVREAQQNAETSYGAPSRICLLYTSRCV